MRIRNQPYTSERTRIIYISERMQGTGENSNSFSPVPCINLFYIFYFGLHLRLKLLLYPNFLLEFAVSLSVLL